MFNTFQVKDLIESIVNENNQDKKLLKEFELVKIILLSIEYEDERIKAMSKEDMLSDVFYELNEASKYITNFIQKNIQFIEEEEKGGDFEASVLQYNEELRSSEEKLKKSIEDKKKKIEIKEKIQAQTIQIKALEKEIDELDEFNKDFEENRLEERESKLALLKKSFDEKFHGTSLHEVRSRYQSYLEQIEEYQSLEENLNKAKKEAQMCIEESQAMQEDLLVYKNHFDANFRLNFDGTKSLSQDIQNSLESYDAKIKLLALAMEEIQNEIKSKNQ